MSKEYLIDGLETIARRRGQMINQGDVEMVGLVIEALRASQAEAGQRDAVDAERYRWLRDRFQVTPDVYDKDSSMLPGTILRLEEWVQEHTDNLDAAIDAARGRSGGSEQG